MLVQALLAELSVERLDERVICGFSRSAEVELHAVEVGPPIQRLRDELRSIVHANRSRQATLGCVRLQNLHHSIAAKPLGSHHSHCKILLTSANFKHARDGIFTEVAFWRRKMRYPGPGKL